MEGGMTFRAPHRRAREEPAPGRQAGAPATRVARATLARDALTAGTPREPGQAAALDRSGSALLALQGRYGNRHVQRVVAQARRGGPAGAAPAIQAKLVLGAAGDRYEREADRVARQVGAQRLADRGWSREAAAERDDLGSSAEQMMKPPAAWHGGAGTTAWPELEASISRASNGGRSLADPVLKPMEQAFGADFRRVRVHQDTASDELCRTIAARAFTVRDHIFFRKGEHAGEGSSGRHLLAHELAHVVQQDPAADGRSGGRYLSGTADGPLPIQRAGTGDQPTLTAIAPSSVPTAPAIAAFATKGRAGFGDHASVYLARQKGEKLLYYKIDLYYAYQTGTTEHARREGSDPDLGKLSWYKHLGYKLFGKARSPGQPLGIRIKIQPLEPPTWAEAPKSRTWTISAKKADKAYQAAKNFRTKAYAGHYYFSPLGMGAGGYNCSKMASKIVQAAGVSASSGLIVHTPAEFALGSKRPAASLKDPGSTKGYLDF
jgi:hypothetical protein